MLHRKPVIAITIGDPSGIGPEVVVKSLLRYNILGLCTPLIIGDKRVVYQIAKKKGINFNVLEDVNKLSFNTKNELLLYDTKTYPSKKIKICKNSKDSGVLSYKYLVTAVDFIKKGYCDCLVTAPISKHAWDLANIKYSGHTELLAKLTNSTEYMMCMINKYYKSALATRHLPLRNVASKITKNLMLKTIYMSHKMMRDAFKYKKFKIAVAALNPHAGDNGTISYEEQKVLVPVVKLMKSKGVNIIGPLPADSLFTQVNEKKVDLIISLYHDQIMIPLKLSDSKSIVNYTYGLPFVRTSPGHGTAFDIAGKNMADPGCMIEAIKYAVKLNN